MMEASAPSSCRFSLRSRTSSSPFSEGMRPARRSEILPAPSRGAEVIRAARATRGAVEFQLLGEEPHELLALLRRNAPGAAVGDFAGVVEGCEVYPRGQVAPLEVEADAQGREDAAADLEANGVVAKEGEVARPAAGAYAGTHRPGEAAVRAGRQP